MACFIQSRHRKEKKKMKKIKIIGKLNFQPPAAAAAAKKMIWNSFRHHIAVEDLE